MFIQNKYSKTYYSIIDNAKQLDRDKKGNERHHILPKSLGGNDCKDNLVNLTPREHYICHLLLTKFTVGVARQKMSYALHRLTNKKNEVIRSSKMYEIIRREHSAMLTLKQTGVSYRDRCGKSHAHPISEYQKEQIRKANKNRVITKETREKISKSQKQRKIDRPESFAKAPMTEEHKRNISKAALGKGEKITFIHKEHGIFVGTNYDLIRAFPAIFDKPWHGPEIWKLANGLYKTCKGWKVLSN
jgi:hypothetical protein